MSDLSEELAHEKERADRAEAELEAYKRESKEMEELLEGEAAKKEAEIRQLKNDAIMKEKASKAQKTELTQLQTDNAKLKEDLAQLQAQANATDRTLLTKLEQEAAAAKKAIEELTQQLANERETVAALTESSKSRQAEWDQKEAQLRKEFQIARSQAEELKKCNEILNEKVSSRPKNDPVERKPPQQLELERQNSKKQIKLGKEEREEKGRLEDAKRRAEEALAKSEKTVKQLRFKVQALMEENESLQARAASVLSNCNSQSVISPFTLKSVVEEEDSSWGRVHYSCLLLTKPHYASPFLELDEEKRLLKIYKSTRTGCYDKSIGLYKHKFDVLSYEQEQVLDALVKAITDAEQVNSHSLVLFGVKKSTKKYLMAKLIEKLKELLLSKLEEESEELEATFMVRSQEEEKNFVLKGEDAKSVGEVIEKAMSIGCRSEKSKEKGIGQKKGQSKPKVRYFSFRTSNFFLELGTSSFTGLAFRDKMTSTSMLNNILYSKLPDVLQPTSSQKYLLLTLNPIVDLYDDCRNTLSTTFCRAQPREEEQAKDWRASPVREELNETAKKKLESIERESEQSSLKIRRLEDECVYFRSRFDELEFRLKGLLNTHAGQNSYLKKSPVTLSYEKLLKFVHSVQSRTATTLNFNASTILRASHIEPDAADAL